MEFQADDSGAQKIEVGQANRLRWLVNPSNMACASANQAFARVNILRVDATSFDTDVIPSTTRARFGVPLMQIIETRRAKEARGFGHKLRRHGTLIRRLSYVWDRPRNAATSLCGVVARHGKRALLHTPPRADDFSFWRSGFHNTKQNVSATQH